MPFSISSWFLDLGTLNIDGYEFRIAYALRQPPRDAAADIRKLCVGARSVLLLPKGIKESTGITEVLLDEALPERQRVIRDIIAASDLAVQVSALYSAPPNARLVVDIRLGRIWFDGIEITGLKPETQAFRFVLYLAKNAPTPINKHVLGAQLSASRNDGDQSARTAKMEVNKHIRTALEANGLQFTDPFKTENGSYRLIVLAYVPVPLSKSAIEYASIGETP